MAIHPGQLLNFLCYSYIHIIYLMPLLGYHMKKKRIFLLFTSLRVMLYIAISVSMKSELLHNQGIPNVCKKNLNINIFLCTALNLSTHQLVFEYSMRYIICPFCYLVLIYNFVYIQICTEFSHHTLVH